MNTLNNPNAIVPKTRARDNIILLEELEFVVPKEQLEHITNLHNEGLWIIDIAKEVKRDPYEVLIALVHQVKQGVEMKPLAFRGRNNV